MPLELRTTYKKLSAIKKIKRFNYCHDIFYLDNSLMKRKCYVLFSLINYNICFIRAFEKFDIFVNVKQKINDRLLTDCVNRALH